MAGKTELLTNAVIIAAHPDDEILWFASVMKQAAQVIILYRNFWADPSLGDRRAEAVRHLPHDNVTWLELDEVGTFDCANWQQPVITPTGLAFSTTSALRDVKSAIKKALPANSSEAPANLQTAYDQNFHKITARLESILTPDMNVFTHNPWGEYGHEDHVQCFRAVDHVRAQKGFRLWMSNYCSERALPLARLYFRRKAESFIRLKTDKIYAEKVADVYRRAGCWTWVDNWAWFEDECFMEAPRALSQDPHQGRLFPLNFFSM